MAEAMLWSPAVASQELFVKLRYGGESGSRGVFAVFGMQIRARECSSGARVCGSTKSVPSGWSGRCRRRVEACASRSRVSLLTSSKNDGAVEIGKTIPAALDELNSAQDPSYDRSSAFRKGEDGYHRLEETDRRTAVLDVEIRDAEVIRERLGGAEPMQNFETRTGTAELMENMLSSYDEGDLAFETGDAEGDAETLPSRKKVEFQGRQISAAGKRKEGFIYWDRLKGSLRQAGDYVGKWAEHVRKRTRVDKIILRDVEFIHDAVNSVQDEFREALRMRGWEESFNPGEISPPWPEPAYSGRSGKDLLAADIEALKSYTNYFRGFLNTWRIPLQLAYDPEAVASYFNRRPHLLLFRFLEVSAAFSGVALQLLLDKARVRRNQSPSDQSVLKNAEALKQTLLRLGPTFIKVAQSLSSRPDIIGIETAKVLSELQDRLPPFPTEEAMALIELDLGVPAAQVFSFLSENPVAAASFGQVFRGRTLEGEEVAVKVQRPDLLFEVALDICVLRVGLRLLRKVAKINSDISVLADELGYGLFGELDYTLEAANAREFGESVRHLSYVKVPRTIPRLTRKRVLTMEWITGYRPVDLQLITDGNAFYEEGLTGTSRREAKLYLDDLVKKGVECSLVQLLETGVMHADPHPGNLLYTKEGTLVYLDFGLLARVTKKHRAAMLAVIAHLVNAEWQYLANDFADLDILKPSTDRFALRLALERAFGEGPDAVVKNGVPDIQFQQVTGKLWKIALKFRFRLPAYYTLVLRALASLEGIAVSADPDYKVFAAAYPYVVKRLLSDNSHPSRQVLQSLVLTQTKEFRWERIAEIMATSRDGSSHDIVLRRAAEDVPAPQPRKSPDYGLASVLLSFTLSKEGRSVRRVLLEADTKSLARAFISPSAKPLRRKVSFALSESFYRSMPTFRDKQWSMLSTFAGQGNGKTTNSFTSKTKEAQHEIQSVGDAENSSSSQLSREPNNLNSHRLWFLLKVLTGRLRSSPILMLRVSWAFVTMVAFAVALALHKYAIWVSDRLLSAESSRTVDLLPRPVDLHANIQPQGESVNAV